MMLGLHNYIISYIILREEVKELKKIVAKLAKEVEALKRSKPGGVEKAEAREKAKRPDYVQLIFKVLEDVMGSKQDAGIVFVSGIERKDGRIVDSFFSGVELEAWTEGGYVIINASLTYLHGGFIHLSVEVYEWTGPSVQVITRRMHTFGLSLAPGSYTVVLRLNDVEVARAVVTVGAPTWLAWLIAVVALALASAALAWWLKRRVAS